MPDVTKITIALVGSGLRRMCAKSLPDRLRALRYFLLQFLEFCLRGGRHVHFSARIREHKSVDATGVRINFKIASPKESIYSQLAPMVFFWTSSLEIDNV